MAEIQEKSKDTVLYGPQWYNIDPKVLSELKELKPHKPVMAACLAWVSIILIVKGFIYLDQWLLYPIVIFFIAGRAGVFLQLAHEAAHSLISKGKFNNWFSNWICCYPIGLSHKEYQDPHLRHHACTNQACDPLSDSEKYKVCNIKNPQLWLLLLKDIVGLTAIKVRFLYDQPIANKYKKDIEDYLETEEGYASYHAQTNSFFQSLKKYFFIAGVQLVILSALFNFNVVHYILLWLMPLITAHMFLMRIRGIAEHGLGIQMGMTNLEEKTRGTYFTRSFGTPVNHYKIPFLNTLERILIGSLKVYYHHEHHLFPKVPYYNLAKVNKLISSQMKQNNPYIFAKGYFDCLFFNLNPTPPAPHPRSNFP